MATRKAPLPHVKESPASSVVRVVGIGASAGGLDAFIDLISAIPVDTGLAFVLVQHLDPRHTSLLADILSGATPLPVPPPA